MTFKQHDIEFPAWLAEFGFQDYSWRNEAAARAERELAGGACLRLWVNYPDPADREFKLALYRLEFCADAAGTIDAGRVLYEGEDAVVVQSTIAAFLAAVV